MFDSLSAFAAIGPMQSIRQDSIVYVRRTLQRFRKKLVNAIKFDGREKLFDVDFDNPPSISMRIRIGFVGASFDC